MNILHHCKKLVSPVFEGRVFLEQTGAFRSVCSGREAPCRSFAGRFRPNVSFQRRHQVRSSYLVTKRLYSEVCDDSKSERKAAVFQEGSQDDDSSQRPSVTFSLDVLVSLLRQENAVDICVIKVPDQLKYTDYFIVVSGVSARHLRAMALYAIKVHKFLKKAGEVSAKIEGKDAEDWMCIDFGNMVVHFMLPEVREVYELEKLWTLRTYDEQLKSMPADTLPEDFIYDIEVTK